MRSARLVLVAYSLAFCSTAILVPPSHAAVGRTVGDANVSPTGEATYSIPIFAPPGTKGLAPELALVYAHRQDEGLAGVGWSISGMSAITRCAKTWVQDGAPAAIRLGTDDRVCLDGNQLKLVSGTYGTAGSTYRTEIDTIARITAQGTAGNGPASFRVEQKNGLIYEYGNSTDSRIESLAVGFTTTARAWALSTIRDREGNTIQFVYSEDGAPYGAYRISAVRYTSNAGQGLAARYEVTFVYETQPTADIDSQYASGGVVKDIKRLDRIDVQYTDGVTTLVRRYELTYEVSLSSTSRSRLSSVQECAGSPLDCLSPTTFTYQNGTNGLGAEVSSGTTIPAGTKVFQVDINGDGRVDMAYPSSAGSGTWMYRLANSSGGYNAAVNSGISNTNHAHAIAFDWNADGLEDIFVPYSGSTWWVIQGSTSGLQSPINTGAPFNTSITNPGDAIALDMNGDGLDDLVWAELVRSLNSQSSTIRVRYRLWGGTWATFTDTLFSVSGQNQLKHPVFEGSFPQSRRRNFDANGDGYRDVGIQTRSCSQICPPNYSSEVILGGGAGTFSVGTDLSQGRPIDINGDGYTDVAFAVSGGVLRYSLSTGKGFGLSIQGPSLTNLDFGKAVPMDWDGDGYEDLLIPNTSTGTWHYLRSSGEGLAAAVNSGLLTSNPQAVYPVDANGDGLDDVAYLTSTRVYAHRLHAGVKADLLTSATDGYGNVVSFAHVPITQGAYTRYANATYPDQDYVGPIYVVQTATPSTGIDSGTYTLTYSYAGLRLNLQGRALTGFDKRTTVDSRNGLTVTEYFRRDFPYIGRLAQRDLTQSNGTLIQRVTNTWDNKQGGTGIQAFYFPYISASIETNYEAGGSYNGAAINEIVTYTTVDQYGTPYDVRTTTNELTSANGVQAGAWYSEQVLHSSLNNNTITWCLGRPGQTEFINMHNQTYGTLITRTITRSWDTTSYCRLTQEVTEPASSTYRVTRTLLYDGFGNVNSETITGSGMLGRTTTVNWGTTGQFPISITNALNQTRTLGWDYAKGVQTSDVDPNSIATSWQYNALARLSRETRPDLTFTDYTLTACNSGNAYCGTSYSRVRTKVHAASKKTSGTEVRYDDSYLDKFDRVVQSEGQTLGGGSSIVRIIYDTLGRVAQRSAPYFAGNTIYYTTAQYDVLNRPTQVSRPIDEGNVTLQATLAHYEGLTSRVVDPQGKESKKVADALARVVRSVDHAGYYQQFDYDAFGSVRRVTDSLANQLLAATYDYGIGAFRRTSNDMDMGSWSYTSNALGEPVSQTDAKGQITTFDPFDGLGRPTKRTEAEGVTTWTWGTSAAAYNIGQLASVSSPGYSEFHFYDSKGRLTERRITSDATYNINYGYDVETGLLDSLTYPTSTAGYRLKLKYEYQYGHLSRVSDFNIPANGFWLAVASDARGNVFHESLGNGLQTLRNFDAVTGWLDYIQSGPGGGTARQNMTFVWDKVGNLTQRKDLNRSLTEDFVYDDLYRLDKSFLNSSPTPNLDIDYDAMGNITKKTDVSTSIYTYHATKKHAIAALGSNTFSYDANGNQTTRYGSTVTWTSYNYPSRINNGSQYHDFFYDANRQRWKQVYFNGSSTETTIFVGGILEKHTSGTTTHYRHYIFAEDQPVALYTRPTSGTITTRYFLLDHQGSVASLTDGAGGAYVNESFKAFGERRNPSTWSGPPSSGDETLIANATRRGYTMHTNLGGSPLVHMNGRVADAQLGRFLSPDPYVPDPDMTQAYNRYSYVYNNPLSYTDPSGFTGEGGGSVCGSAAFFCEAAIFALNSIFGGGSAKPKPGCYGPPVGCYGQEGLPRTPGFNATIGSQATRAGQSSISIGADTAFASALSIGPADAAVARVITDPRIGPPVIVIGGISVVVAIGTIQSPWAILRRPDLMGEKPEYVPRVDRTTHPMAGASEAAGGDPNGQFDPDDELQRKYRTPTDRYKEQLTQRDLDAARRELRGEIVSRRPDGSPFDHVQKVRNAQAGLLDRIQQINRRLGHPGLSEPERFALRNELSEASRLLDRSEAFVPR